MSALGNTMGRRRRKVPFGWALANTLLWGSAVGNSGATVHTWTGANIGPHISGKKLIIFAGGSGGTTSQTLTVNGVAATAKATQTSNNHCVTLFEIDAPSASTADFVLTTNANTSSVLAIFSVQGLETNTALDTGGGGSSCAIDTLLGGVTFAVCTAAPNTSTQGGSWTGATQITEVNASPTSMVMSIAAYEGATEANHAIIKSGSNLRALLAATYK